MQVHPVTYVNVHCCLVLTKYALPCSCSYHLTDGQLSLHIYFITAKSHPIIGTSSPFNFLCTLSQKCILVVKRRLMWLYAVHVDIFSQSERRLTNDGKLLCYCQLKHTRK